MNFVKILPPKLNIGDTIGVVAPSNPIIGDNIEELNRAKEIAEKSGFKVTYSKNLFSNTNGYCSTAKEKAEDILDNWFDGSAKELFTALSEKIPKSEKERLKGVLDDMDFI